MHNESKCLKTILHNTYGVLNEDMVRVTNTAPCRDFVEADVCENSQDTFPIILITGNPIRGGFLDFGALYRGGTKVLAVE